MLELLRTFLLVTRTESFTQAARAVGLSRPAVSQHIHQLEEYFGLQLVARTTRKVALTAAGQVLLDHAQQVLARADEMDAAMASIKPSLKSGAGDR